MDLSRPASAVVPSLDAEVLRVLAGTTAPMSGRHIHSLTTVGSQQQVARILRRLVGTGLVHLTRAGAANLYVLNRDHVACGAVLAMSGLRSRLFERISEHLRTWPVPPLAASIFGSAARGDGDEHSDVDILLVRPTSVTADSEPWATSVHELGRKVEAWCGNVASIMQADPTELAQLELRHEPVVTSIKSDEVKLLGSGIFSVRGSHESETGTAF